MAKKKRKKIPVTFTFPPEDVEWLALESERTCRPKNYVLMIAMELYRQSLSKISK
jgi:predicted DNA-binding protein